MEYRKLGSSDLLVSEVGLGGNVFGPPRLTQEQSTENINHALSLGINFIDTAFGYGEGQSEIFVGNAVRDKRDQFIIATKFNLRNRKDGETVGDRIRSQCEESLRKLQMSHIDLYQIHQPDPSISEEEILEPLSKLLEEGKIRYIGECNYGAWRHAVTNHVATNNGWPLMVSAQNNYNILRRHVELEILPYCDRFNIGFLPYFPLGGGFLTGKYKPGQEPPAGSRGAEGSGIIAKTRTQKNENTLVKLETFAGDRGRSVLDLAIGWLLAQPSVSSVIAGASNTQQIDSNAAGASWKLSPEELAEINTIASWDGTGELVDGSAGGVGARAGLRPR